MSQTIPDPRGKVRLGRSLSEAEEQHVSSRRETVLQCLKQHNISCKLEEVPNIAVLASGGGERAMVGLLGSLLQLQRDGLLDCILYLSGVSGSTWCMASLYSQPDWSLRLEAVKDDIVKRLGADSISWQERAAKLERYSSCHDNFNMTHVFAALYVSDIVKEIDERVLSAQRGQHSKDPYPIYAVIDKQSKQDGMKADPWLELTHHEAGYSLTGAFVDSACFGSQFDNGNLKKEQPEIDMLYLQGLCGSAIAESEGIQQQIADWIKSQVCSSDGCSVLLTVLDLYIHSSKDEDPLPLITVLNKLLEGKRNMQGEEMTFDTEGWLKLELTAQKGKIRSYILDICQSFCNWYEDVCKGPWVKLIIKSIECVLDWQWGTTYNFLHKMTAEGVHPSVLAAEKREYLDAGLLLNTAYFSTLRPERHIDLIISLDYSAGDPMLTVKDAFKMSKDLGIAFPHVALTAEANAAPKDFYVFEGGSDAPTVIHMPLFNTTNCGGDVATWENRYSTFQGAYSPDMISDMLEISAVNVRNNKDKLLQEIEKIVKQKKSKQTASSTY